MYIEVKNVSKTIKGARVLDDVSLKLEGGRVYGLKGKNGSGKTMLMRAMCGLIKPSSGVVDINGRVLGKEISFPPSIGVLIENPAFLSKYTGFKNLKILAGIQNKIDDEKIRQTLKSVGLDPDDKRTYRKYSLGMKQRLGIACAVMENPDIILLDEPINALDENGVLLVRGLLREAKERGAVIVVACHDTEELELLADEIFVLYEGKITDHTVIQKDVEEHEA